MIDTGELDLTKLHTVMGAGPGQDLYIQNGRYFTSWGKPVEANEQAFRENGIPWTREVQLEVQKRALQAKADAHRRKLEEQIAKIEEEESSRIKAGLPPSFLEDPSTDTLSEPLDLDGLDDLLTPPEEPVKVKVKSKK